MNVKDTNNLQSASNPMTIIDKDILTKQISNKQGYDRLQSQNSNGNNMMLSTQTLQNRDKSLGQVKQQSFKQKTIAGQLNPQYSHEDYTNFIFPCIKLKRSNKIKLITAILVLALILERYSFLVTVYKTKYFGYFLIMIVIALNTVFSGILALLRKKKRDKRLHQMFNIQRTPSVGFCVVGFIGLLDMFYAFFLFWPANVMPIWLLIILLQLFIPLKFFCAICMHNLQFFKVHIYSALIIIIGIVLALISLKDLDNSTVKYSSLFILCQFFDVISITIKEGLVRSQPLNQEQFNFKITLSQFIIGVLLTPIILAISQSVDYSGQTDPKDPDPFSNGNYDNFFQFMGVYMKLSVKCIFSVDAEDDDEIDNRCDFSFLYVFIYVCSLFIIQLSIQYLMRHKKGKNAKWIFSFMVPLTVLAFVLSILTIGGNEVIGTQSEFNIFYGFGLALVMIGVFLFNYFEEKKQKASIESF
eukprot:403356997